MKNKREIPGFPGYFLRIDGKVISKKTKKPLKERTNNGTTSPFVRLKNPITGRTTTKRTAVLFKLCFPELKQDRHQGRDRLEAYIEKEGINQSEAARRLGVDRSVVNRILNPPYYFGPKMDKRLEALEMESLFAPDLELQDQRSEEIRRFMRSEGLSLMELAKRLQLSRTALRNCRNESTWRKFVSFRSEYVPTKGKNQQIVKELRNFMRSEGLSLSKAALIIGLSKTTLHRVLNSPENVSESIFERIEKAYPFKKKE